MKRGLPPEPVVPVLAARPTLLLGLTDRLESGVLAGDSAEADFLLFSVLVELLPTRKSIEKPMRGRTAAADGAGGVDGGLLLLLPPLLAVAIAVAVEDSVAGLPAPGIIIFFFFFFPFQSAQEQYSLSELKL